MLKLQILLLVANLSPILSGCSSLREPRKVASAACSVESQTGCQMNQVCMNASESETACRTIPQKPPIEFILPFDKNSEVFCTHSSGVGSHSWPNAFYSLDLATDYKKDSSIITAAADGKVFTFGDNNGQLCPEPAGSPEKTPPDKCGQGWGNHIKILHTDGYYSFYVHLKKFFVQNGQFVKAGEAIGVEGATGLAGHRHLHWSVQKLPGSSQKEWEDHITWDGESVPFDFAARVNGQNQTVDSAKLRCAHANIGQAPPEQQPRLQRQ